jgi:hypothetical protein
MNIMAPQNEVENLRIVNPKNEIGFITHDGFKTMPMTFKHKESKNKDTEFGEQNLFDTNQFIGNNPELWKIVANRKTDEITNRDIMEDKIDLDPNTKYEETKFDMTFDNRKLLLKDLLKNRIIKESQDVTHIHHNIDDVNDLDSRNLESGRSNFLVSGMWDEIENDENEMQERMDYGNMEYYFLEDILNSTARPIELVTPILEEADNGYHEAAKEDIEKDDTKEADYKQYYDDILAMYNYDDFNKIGIENTFNDAEEEQVKQSNESTTDKGPNHTKYDSVEPEPVYIVYPATESMETVIGNYSTETTTMFTEATNENTTEYSIDYKNFL